MQQLVPVNQPRDQAYRASADSAHRQGRRRAGGDATTGLSDSDFIEDCGSPAGAVRRQSHGGACDHADVPMPHEEDRQVEEGSSPRISDPSASPSNFATLPGYGQRWHDEKWSGSPRHRGRRQGARDSWSWGSRRVVLVPALSCTSAQLGSLFDRQKVTGCFRCSVVTETVMTVFTTAVLWCSEATPSGALHSASKKKEKERERERKKVVTANNRTTTDVIWECLNSNNSHLDSHFVNTT